MIEHAREIEPAAPGLRDQAAVDRRRNVGKLALAGDPAIAGVIEAVIFLAVILLFNLVLSAKRVAVCMGVNVSTFLSKMVELTVSVGFCIRSLVSLA